MSTTARPLGINARTAAKLAETAAEDLAAAEAEAKRLGYASADEYLAAPAQTNTKAAAIVGLLRQHADARAIDLNRAATRRARVERNHARGNATGAQLSDAYQAEAIAHAAWEVAETILSQANRFLHS